MQKITDKKSYLFFLEADRIALGRKKIGFLTSNWIKEKLFPDHILRFQKLLRKVEYYQNLKTNFFYKIYFALLYKKFLNKSLKLGFSIHPNNFGPGLSIAHYGTIVINQAAKIGANCRIHVGVNIGSEAGQADFSPVLGDNIYIGPGAKLFGKILIADGCVIGANAVVNSDFFEKGSLLVGIPASKKGEVDSTNFLLPATSLVGLKGIEEIIGQPASKVKEFLSRK